jgi:hypothetical protein
MENNIRRTSVMEDLAIHLPDTFAIRSAQNYVMFLQNDFISRDNRTFFFPTENCQLLLEVEDEYPIEKFCGNSDYLDFGFYSYSKFFIYMFTKLNMQKFWIFNNQNYVKKFNFNKDSASWEGWRIDCRTKPRKEKGFNIVFIFLRRKFIPPLHETFQNINLIMTQEYEVKGNLEISSNAIKILEMCADSLTSEYIHSSTYEARKIIEVKMESFVMNTDSLDYFYNTLKTYSGKETFKLGLDFTFKVILTLEEHVKDTMSYIKERFVKRLQAGFYLLGNKDFNLHQYEKEMRNIDFQQLLVENDNYFKKFLESNDMKLLETWENKRNDFLAFCMNGGFCFKMINISYIISLTKRISELETLNSLIDKCLNLRVINFKNEPLESKIGAIVNNMFHIKEISFNEEVMAVLIQTEYLRVLHEVESDHIYIEFISFLLRNQNLVSNKLLYSFYIYLKEIIKGETNESLSNSDSSNLKKCLNSMLLIILKIYSNFENSPTTLTIACKCLCILTTFDKFNKTTLIAENCLLVISNYISSPDEKLLYYSAQLLTYIISEARDNIKELIEKNSKLIPKCLKILKGSSIPGCYYSTKTITLVVKVIIILLNMQNSQVKEKLSEKGHRKFVKYLFNYIQNNQLTLPQDMEQTIHIQQMIFNILEILVKKNTELRRYMEDNYRFLKLLDFRAVFYFDVIQHVLGICEVINANIVEHTEAYMKMILAMFYFLRNYISSDLQIVKAISLNCPNLIQVIALVYENNKKEAVNSLALVCNDLFRTLFVDDLSDDKKHTH